TRCYRDWSSDVCSSDLKLPKPLKIALAWENTDHGKDYQAAVNKAAKDDPSHFQVVLDQSFDLNGSDFTPLLTQVKAANADAFLRSEERRVGKGGRAELV